MVAFLTQCTLPLLFEHCRQFGESSQSNFILRLPSTHPFILTQWHTSYIRMNASIIDLIRIFPDNLSHNRLSSNLVARNFLDRQYVNKSKLQNVLNLPVLFFLPFLGVHSISLKKKLCKFLGKLYPHSDFKFAFQSVKRSENFFPFKNRARVLSSLRLFLHLRV